MLKLKRNEELALFILIGAALGLAFLLKLSVFKGSPMEVMRKESDNQAGINVQEKASIYVYITGEVIKPGVYELKAGDRVSDIIKMAGGFTEKADDNAINMAEKLRDEMHITVPAKDENMQEGAKRSSISSGKININTATAEELDSFLPGIGSTLSKSIVEYREKNGRFKSVDEVTRVNGIGSGKRFEKIKDMITVNCLFM